MAKEPVDNVPGATAHGLIVPGENDDVIIVTKDGDGISFTADGRIYVSVENVRGIISFLEEMLYELQEEGT